MGVEGPCARACEHSHVANDRCCGSPDARCGSSEAANRMAAIIERIEQSPEDAHSSEDEVMAAAIAEIAAMRRARRDGRT